MLQAREDEGGRALAFMGITVKSDSPASGGLSVGAVQSASPADNAGLLAGDLLTGFEGVRILSKADINPSGGSRFATLTVRRNGQEETKQVSMLAGTGVPTLKRYVVN